MHWLLVIIMPGAEIHVLCERGSKLEARPDETLLSIDNLSGLKYCLYIQYF